ncbi:putative Light-harvesting LHII; alpha subunit B / Histone protein [Paratrimastix pyriformis]|uniref:Light-harvesting LHII n=1 Tax=Paratrimastix pyriformis TaxID=342808 RepID=A0ABQ8U5T8_9EUKA|nr:putative Light-harvesting LHII; alpha subunit B / Histone protein [Paratrimastix pyriformis]
MLNPFFFPGSQLRQPASPAALGSLRNQQDEMISPECHPRLTVAPTADPTSKNVMLTLTDIQSDGPMGMSWLDLASLLRSNDATLPALLGRFLLPSTTSSTLGMGWMTDTVLYVVDHGSYGGRARIGFYDMAKNFSVVGELIGADITPPGPIPGSHDDQGHGLPAHPILFLTHICLFGASPYPHATQDVLITDVLIMYSAFKGDSGTLTSAGLVRHCRAVPGSCTGVSNSSNSLVGDLASANIGWTQTGSWTMAITELPDGSYLVGSPKYETVGSGASGALTWCAGGTGCTGTVNGNHPTSLVGSHSGDSVGSQVRVLADGSYVVFSSTWNTNRGFVAVGSSTHPVTGVVSATNSLIGTTVADKVGLFTESSMFGSTSNMHFTDNGTFIMASTTWTNSATSISTGGAYVFFNPQAGIVPVGTIDETNALIGTTSSVPNFFYLATHHSYLVTKHGVAGDSTHHGFVHWCSGVTGCVGKIEEVAQLKGTATRKIKPYVLTLTNDNFVVYSALYDDPANSRTGIGFAMLCSGLAGCPSTITATTALVGASSDAFVSRQGIWGLPDGGYVVASAGLGGSSGGFVISCPTCTRGTFVNAGLVAKCGADGSGCMGQSASLANCLTGTAANMQLGLFTKVLANDSLIIAAPGFDGKGAVFWYSSTEPLEGTPTAANALIGSTAGQLWAAAASLLSRLRSLLICPRACSTTCLFNQSSWRPPPPTLPGARSQVGDGALILTPNGDYLVWSKTSMLLTWCSGSVGCRGVTVTDADTITGIPTSEVPALVARAGGDYLISISTWNHIVWGPKAAPFPKGKGPLGPTTALTGVTRYYVDTSLPNGAFLLSFSQSLSTAGSITWCSGTDPCVGTVSAERSLVGEAASDQVRDAAEGMQGRKDRGGIRADREVPVDLSEICPTATGCAGVVTNTSLSLVGTATQAFGTNDAAHIRFLPNGRLASHPPSCCLCVGPQNPRHVCHVLLFPGSNIVFQIDGTPTSSSGRSFTMCIPGVACSGTLSASNTFGASYGTQVFMPPVGTPEYAASSFYATVPDAADGKGAVRLCSGTTFDCAGTASFTAANSALGSTAHSGLGYRDLLIGTNGLWATHTGLQMSYLPYVDGHIPYGAITEDNFLGGGDSSISVDLQAPALVETSTHSVQVGLDRLYHNHFEVVAAETTADRVVIQFWVDEPVQMVGWVATMKVTHPTTSFSVTENLIFNQSGRASVSSCSSCSFEAGSYPTNKRYNARISLWPAAFFTNPVFESLLDFAPAPAFDPVTPFSPSNCYTTGMCEVHIKATHYTLPARVKLNGAEGSVLPDSTTSDLHVYLPYTPVVGAYPLTLISNDGQEVSTTFYILSSDPAIYSVEPECPPEGCTVTIIGTGFNQPVFNWCGTNLACSFINGTLAICQMPPSEAESSSLSVRNDANGRSAMFHYTYKFVYPQVSYADPQLEATGGNITIYGSDFVLPTVTIEGRPCPVLSVSVALDEIVCTAPEAPKEHCQLTVTTGSAGHHTSTVTYNYILHHPVITAVGPTCLLTGGCAVTVTGSEFFHPVVTMGSSTHLNCSASSATQVNCTVPAGSVAVANLTVINMGGYAASTTYAYQVQTPMLTACTPTVCPAATGCLLALSGSAFELSTVTLGGVACPLVSAEATLILAQCGPSTLHGSQNVTVTNAGGPHASRLITVQGPTPTFASVTPNAGPALTTGPSTLVIMGASFWADPAAPGTCPGATIGTTACTVTACTATSLTCVLPAHDVSRGAANLVVTNADGVVGTLMGAYVFQGEWPTLVAISPPEGPLAGGQTVTLVGTGIRAGAAATLAGKPCTSVAVLLSGGLTCTAPAGDAIGLVDVTLTNSDLTTATLAAAYAYQGAAPTIQAVWPSSGPTSGSTALTLTGTGFRAGVSVLLGSLPCTGLVVHNETTITCTSPPGSEAKVNVTVTNADRTSTALPLAFEYTPVGSPVYPPVLISISPATCRATSSLAATLVCSNVRAGVTVTVGGLACTGLTLVGSRIRCTIPVGGTVGSADVTVRNTDGLSTTAVGAFTFTGTAPTVGGVSPSTLAAASGPTTITVTGSDFRPGCTVRVGALPCTGIVIAADGNSLQCTINPTAAATTAAASNDGRNDGAVAIGPADVVVTNADGTVATLPTPFYFQAEAPTLSGLSPRRGSFKSATRVTLLGTHLRPNATVLVGGQACLDVEVLTSETVRAYVPPPPEGTPAGADWVADVQLLNYDMSSALLSDAFTYVAATATADEDYLTGGVSGGSIALFVVGALMLAGGLVAALVVFLIHRRRRSAAASPVSPPPLVAAGSLAEAGQGPQTDIKDTTATEMMQINPMIIPAATTAAPPPPPPPSTVVVLLASPSAAFPPPPPPSEALGLPAGDAAVNPLFLSNNDAALVVSSAQASDGAPVS